MEAWCLIPILVDESSRVIVQGITGAQGSFHTRQMLEYGTRIVAGVTPGKGGTEVLGVSVYDTVEEAIAREEADVSIIFVPAPFAKGAVFEAIETRLKTIIVITEHIPIKDSVDFLGRANQSGITVIGPNTPGVITAGQTKIGIMPAQVFKPGTVGIVSRSGTLTYEIASRITNSGLGETTCVGIGGDPITGCGFVDVLQRFVNDQMTQAVVLVGEIGGNAEELAAEYIGTKNFPKPVVAYVAGRSAPPGKRMGHAGAIIMGNVGTAESKIRALTSAGALVAEKLADIPKMLAASLGK